MSTHQAPDGRWFVRWRDAGRNRKKVFGRGDIAHHQAVRFDHDLKRGKGKIDSEAGITVAEVCQAYHNQHPVERSTGLNDYYKFDRHILPFFGAIEAELIATKDLNAYIKKRQSQEVKNVTIATEIRRLKAAMNWALSQEPPLVLRNPAARFRVPMAKDSATPNPPSRQEIGLILEHAAPHLLRAISLLWHLGLRPGQELASVTWDSVNFDRRDIRIRGARKGGPVERSVPFGNEFKEVLLYWRGQDSAWSGSSLGSTSIVHYRGKPVVSLKTAWATAKNRAGIHRRLRLYDLRHAFASIALEHGADLKSVSEVLGHSRPDTTLRAYQHVTKQQHRDVIAKIPQLGNILGNTFLRIVPGNKE